MRGLKQCQHVSCAYIIKSHLLQMRGLKHFCLDREHHRHEVASFTDAWIETEICALRRLTCSSHLLQMRGLKLQQFFNLNHLSKSHLLQMRGLKQHEELVAFAENKSHLLQMRGLKLLREKE